MSEQPEEKEKELKFTARLVSVDQEIATVIKTLKVSDSDSASSEEESDEDSTAKTIDDTLTDFLNEFQDVANQNGYVIGKKAFINATTSLLLFVIRGSEDAASIDIEVEKIGLEEEEDGEGKEDDS